MKFASLIVIATLGGIPATGALAADYKVQRTLQTAASASDVWNMVGDFCDIDDWHPAVASCALKSIDGSVHRILTLVDGAEFVEKLIATEMGISYTYQIISSPLPIENYTATFSVESLDGSAISWSGSFSSDVPEMEATIAGIYESGLAAIEASLP